MGCHCQQIVGMASDSFSERPKHEGRDNRGLRHLNAIATRHAQITAACSTEPSITNLSWEYVAPLFALASRIKPGKSPVLSCKMCHFLFPKLFVVVDNTATGLFEYELYWRGMKEEWSRFAQRGSALNLLVGTMQNTRPIHPLYPYETKMMDLCHIGYNNRYTALNFLYT